ncbi:hypothetical protein [Nocardia brasiliensis]|uniref:hypothetical protein n=1 Tax=Nocardia brasiliensis TaxID=37326 RepID=UPI00366A5F53
MIRRNQHIRELAYYRRYSSGPANLAGLGESRQPSVVDREDFQTAKGLTGLDQHHVPCWRSWHRWTLLPMLAHAFLTVLAIDQRATEATPDGLIASTRNEIRHLFAVIIITPIRTITYRLHWSNWRRQHQHRARTSPYQQRPRQLT